APGGAARTVRGARGRHHAARRAGGAGPGVAPARRLAGDGDRGRPSIRGPVPGRRRRPHRGRSPARPCRPRPGRGGPAAPRVMGSVVHVVDPELADPASIAEAVAAIEAGGLVVLPTETVYGIACRPDDGAATARLFAAKRRPARLSLPVLTSSVPEAFELGIPTPGAAALAEAFWPGPLTMVLARTERSAPWRL